MLCIHKQRLFYLFSVTGNKNYCPDWSNLKQHFLLKFLQKIPIKCEKYKGTLVKTTFPTSRHLFLTNLGPPEHRNHVFWKSTRTVRNRILRFFSADCGKFFPIFKGPKHGQENPFGPIRGRYRIDQDMKFKFQFYRILCIFTPKSHFSG